MNIFIRDSAKLNTFANIFKHLKVYGLHFNIYFHPTKFYIQGMDSAKVSLFELTLEKSWFDEYTVEQTVAVGLNIEILFKILNMNRDDQILQINLKEGGDFLDIVLDGKIKQLFSVPLMDINDELLGVPEDTEWSADLEIQSKLLSELMNKQSLFGEIVTVKCTEKDVTITTSDQMIGTMATEIQFDDLIEYGVEEGASIEVSYSLKFILNMTSFAEISNIVTMNISKTLPMRMHYSLDIQKEDEEGEEGTSPASYMNFYLAPKINEDD